MSEPDFQQRLDAKDRQIADLVARLEAALARIAALEAKLAENSSNSNKPPSTDAPYKARPPKVPTGKKQGGQRGHKRNLRPLLPPDHVSKHIPGQCAGCGHSLHGEDPNPLRRQSIDIPTVKPIVTEDQLHSLTCPRCGMSNTLDIPTKPSVGPVLTGLISFLTIRHRQSKRLVQSLLENVFGVELSLGMICNLEQRVSAALAAAHQEASTAIQKAPSLNIDDSGFFEGRGEGRKNSAHIWALVTPLLSVFYVRLSKGAEVVQALLKDFAGIMISDRAKAYLWVDAAKRQLCWAHLLRDFEGWKRHGLLAEAIADGIQEQIGEFFVLWWELKEKRFERKVFQEKMVPIRARVEELLEVALHVPGISGSAKDMVSVKAGLWSFVDNNGVEPTNNEAERVLRPAVIMKKLTFGTMSEGGSRFVERVLTVETTLRKQGKDALAFIVESIRAFDSGLPAPSLFRP